MRQTAPCYYPPSALHFLFPPPTEHLGEVRALSTVLTNRQDLKVHVGPWHWSEDCQWPPVEAVLRAPLWKHPEFDVLRQRLKRPTPNIQVRAGSAYVTINTVGETTVEAAGAEEDEPAEVCTPQRTVLEGGGQEHRSCVC